MPTAIASIPSDINATAERVIDAGKRLGTVYLDGSKNTVAAAISGGRKTSGELTKTCTAVVREVVPV